MRARAILLSFAALAACKKEPPSPDKPAIKVAAASDLAHAFPAVAAAFEKKNGTKVTFSFGSTGLLAKQIQEGAPFDVFAAANVSFVDDTIKSGACKADTKQEYAEGRLAIWWKKDLPIAAPTSIADLADARFQKIAIANPEHAPYGMAAVEALKKSGLYDNVKPKLVFGENIQQTIRYAQSGNVEAAIVSLSLALSSSEGGAFVKIDPMLHSAIHQALVVCGDRKEQSEAAVQFAAFVTSPEGRAILREHGFVAPGEGIATAP